MKINSPKGLTPYPFQEDAVRFALARKNSYLALDPGLGKTICAALILSTWNDMQVTNGLYICPPFLTRDAEEKLRAWGNFEVARYPTDKPFYRGVLIMPDSHLIRPEALEAIQNLFMVKGVERYVLVVDEAHRYKNESAKRTKALLRKIFTSFHRTVFMSGTPLSNRPMELYSILNAAAPETIDRMTRFEYGMRFCAGFEGQWGWDFSGASNMRELAARVKPKFLLRTKKADVLTELPPKIEELFVMGGDEPQALTKLTAHAVGALPKDDTPIKEEIVRELQTVGDPHVASYRRLLGLAKVKEAAEIIKGILEDSEESILVFAIHTEVIAELQKKLARNTPLVVTGSTSMSERHMRVQAFQAGASRLFIGNIQAAGVGITLTKATRVIFVEASWVPAENDQAADRCHRIGQRDSVLVQYLCFRNSLDRTVLLTNFRKRKITDHI